MKFCAEALQSDVADIEQGITAEGVHLGAMAGRRDLVERVFTGIKAMVFFNSLIHGLDVGPILKTSVPASQVALGLVTIIVLCWFAGVLIAGNYNPGARPGKR